MLLCNISLSRQILISKMEKENKMTITKDLQTVSKELTKLAKQTEKLAASLGKAEKPKAKSVATRTTKAKAVTKK